MGPRRSRSPPGPTSRSSDCSELPPRTAAGRLPAGWAYRLPTEAEWEYACRGWTSDRRFSYGDDPGYTNLATYAWYRSNSGSQTQPVGQKPPNPWGLYDMCGNVWEWCQDWYAPSYPGDSVTDPQGPPAGTERVLRGGSWDGFARRCRSACRIGDDPTANYYDNYGFRTKILSCGRLPRFFGEVAAAGTDICTMKLEFMRMLYEHPFTDKRMGGFLKDWGKVFGDKTWPEK